MRPLIALLFLAFLAGCGHAPIYYPATRVVETAGGPKVCAADGYDCHLLYPPPQVVPYYFYPNRSIGFVWTYTSPGREPNHCHTCRR